MHILSIISIIFLILTCMVLVVTFTMGAGQSKTPYQQFYEDEEQMLYLHNYNNKRKQHKHAN